MVVNKSGGYLIGLEDINNLIKYTSKLVSNDNLTKKLGIQNMRNIKQYTIDKVIPKMKNIYGLGDNNG